MLHVALALAPELVARAPGTGAEWAAALRHEALDHPMERQAVEVAQLRQVQEARHVHRRDVGKQLDDDGAFVGLHVDDIARAGFERESRWLRERGAPVRLRLVHRVVRDQLFDLFHGPRPGGS